MRDDNDETGHCPSGRADSPPRRWPRLAAVTGLLLVGLLAAVGPAAASPPIVTPSTDVPPIGRWVRGGAQVDVPDLFGSTTWYSDRANEPVEVECGGAVRTKVRGYFGAGDSLLVGWTSTKNVTTKGWAPQQCGLLDLAAVNT